MSVFRKIVTTIVLFFAVVECEAQPFLGRQAPEIPKNKIKIEYDHDFKLAGGYCAMGVIGAFTDGKYSKLNIGFSYGYRVVERLKVVGNFAIGVNTDWRAALLKFAPAIQYEWFNRGIVTMYSEIGVILQYSRYSSFKADLSLTPFGLTVGKELYGFVELASFGSRGLINAGIGYRF